MLAGCAGAFRLIHGERPAVMAGFGGYPTIRRLPPRNFLACRCWFTSRMPFLAGPIAFSPPRARVVATSFAETRPAVARRTVTVGVPVRDAIAALNRVAYRPPGPQEDVNLLVVGGKPGSRDLQHPAARCRTMPRRSPCGDASRWCSSAGRKTSVEPRRPGAPLGVTATVAPFFEEMAGHLAHAHLVVARAGASTIAELAVSGRPSVLIPFPGAADDHQTANATVVVNAGADGSSTRRRPMPAPLPHVLNRS